MRVIDHRQFVRNKPQSKHWPRARIVGWIIAALGAVLVVLNAGLWIVYRNKVLPNYSVGAVPVGGVAFKDIPQHVTAQSVLPASVTLRTSGQSKRITPAELGIMPDTEATITKLKQTRPLLPMLSLVMHHTVPVQVRVEDSTFAAASKPLEQLFSKQALGKHIVFKDGAFAIADPQQGYALDTALFRPTVTTGIATGQRTITVPVRPTSSTITVADIQGELQKLQKELNTSISYVYTGHTVKPAAEDIGTWYVADGATMALSHDAIAAYIQKISSQMGVTAVNADEAVTASVYAVTKNQQLNFRLVSSQGTIVYKYCAAQRGLNDSVLSDFRLKLAATYGDVRGWNDNGRIAFIYSEAGCQLRDWLAASGSMTSFGAICDDYYSCTVYPNVVINYDRWNGATDPWNAQHLGIEDYRAMAINHESGHWLGFDHVACPGVGQPAAVMQQQSIDLGGCTFNPWPLLSEAARAGR